MIWFLIILGLVVGAFCLGRRIGQTEIKRDNIGRGTWIEFTKPSKSQSFEKTIDIPAGVQGIVSGVDKWCRFSVLVGKPWADLFDGRRLYDISDFSSVRIIPFYRVPEDMRNETLETLSKEEIEVAKLNDAIFPPGFLELQKLLNRSGS